MAAHLKVSPASLFGGGGWGDAAGNNPAQPRGGETHKSAGSEQRENVYRQIVPSNLKCLIQCDVNKLLSSPWTPCCPR